MSQQSEYPYPNMSLMNEHLEELKTVHDTLRKLSHAGLELFRASMAIHGQITHDQAPHVGVCNDILHSFGIDPLKLINEIVKWEMECGPLPLRKMWEPYVPALGTPIPFGDPTTIIDYFDRDVASLLKPEEKAALREELKQVVEKFKDLEPTPPLFADDTQDIKWADMISTRSPAALEEEEHTVQVIKQRDPLKPKVAFNRKRHLDEPNWPIIIKEIRNRRDPLAIRYDYTITPDGEITSADDR